MNNCITNEIKNFSRLFALDPQISFKQKWHHFLSQSMVSSKLHVYEYKDANIRKGLLPLFVWS